MRAQSLLLLYLFTFIMCNYFCLGKDEEIKIPSYVTICYRDDPKVSACMKRNIQKLLPMFKKGSPDFDLESLDPALFGNLHFRYKSPIVGGDVFAKNCYLHGISDGSVLSIRPKLNVPNLFKLDFDFNFPQLFVKADYDLTGNVLNIPVNLAGRLDVLFENINITYHVIGKTKTINDYDYLELEEFAWRIKTSGVKKLSVRNSDVVDGKPALNRMVINVLNSSWRPLMDQILPSILPEADKKMKAMFYKAFKKYPYDIIFPRRTRSQVVENQW